MIKMLTDLKSEIVASKTTEETADAFDQVCYIYSFLKSDLTPTRAHRTTSEHTGPHDVVQRHENCRIENCAHFYFQIQSFGDDFSDEPNESPFDLFAEMENAETEEAKVDPFFETGISISITFGQKDHPVLDLVYFKFFSLLDRLLSEQFGDF